MTDKPLKLDDHKFLYNSTGGKLEAGFLLSDIQSAKRLLKYTIWHKSSFIEHLTNRQQTELMNMIDACFQIDDGVKEARP